MKKILIGAAAGVMLCLAGCGDYVGKEATHPLFSKGLTNVKSRNFSDAAQAFEEFLLICPKSARTHKELAELYSDQLNNPTRAIYHFEKYAELAKLGSTEAQQVGAFVELNRQKAYEQYQTEKGLTPRPAPVIDENMVSAIRQERDALRKKITQFSNAYNAVVKENTVMKKKLQEIATERTRTGSGARVTPPVVRPGGATPSGTTTQPGATPRLTGETYTVKSGDTLHAIAKRIYGNSAYYKHIIDANRDQLNDRGNIRVGQVLKIPQLPLPSEGGRGR